MTDPTEQDEMAELLGSLDPDDESSDDSTSAPADPPEAGAKKKASKKKTSKKSTPPPAPKEPKGYAIAHGKALSCGRRGILTAGEPVTVEDFSDGEPGLQALVDAGYVVAR